MNLKEKVACIYVTICTYITTFCILYFLCLKLVEAICVVMDKVFAKRKKAQTNDKGYINLGAK